MAKTGSLGKVYQDGEAIVRQGEVGDCMYVIQEGQVEVMAEKDDKEVRLMVLDTGELFGEMAIVEHEVRMATVRALGQVRVLTIDQKNFLRRIHEDPSLAWRIVQTMSRRIRELATEVARLKGNE
jgi:CRP/FNR family transcriptional regulator